MTKSQITVKIIKIINYHKKFGYFSGFLRELFTVFGDRWDVQFESELVWQLEGVVFEKKSFIVETDIIYIDPIPTKPTKVEHKIVRT